MSVEVCTMPAVAGRVTRQATGRCGSRRSGAYAIAFNRTQPGWAELAFPISRELSREASARHIDSAQHERAWGAVASISMNACRYQPSRFLTLLGFLVLLSAGAGSSAFLAGLSAPAGLSDLSAASAITAPCGGTASILFSRM